MDSSTSDTSDRTSRRDEARGWHAGDAVRHAARSPTFLLIPLVYAAVGTTWIVTSDWIVEHYVAQPGSQTVKGLAYVALLSRPIAVTDAFALVREAGEREASIGVRS